MPLDFVSTHVYPNDPQKYIFGKDNLYTFEEVIPRGVEQVKQQVEASEDAESAAMDHGVEFAEPGVHCRHDEELHRAGGSDVVLDVQQRF